jgi:N-formylglutamate amidohydrolase
MILRQSYDLELDTKEKIQRLQLKRDSGEMTEDEYEDKYESVMQDYHLQLLRVL